MGTPYECLERVATDVAPHVPDNESILHVEVDFGQQPFEVRFNFTPYDRKRFYDLSSRIPIAVPLDLVLRVRPILSDYFTQVQLILKRLSLDRDLVFLRVSVTSDGSFFVGETCRPRLSCAAESDRRLAEANATAEGGRDPTSTGHPMTIQFPDRPEPWYDAEHHTISFPVRVDGQPMSCVVTAADLMHRFEGRPPSTPAEARLVYEHHKDTLRRLAEALIRGRGATRPREEFAIDLWDREP